MLKYVKDPLLGFHGAYVDHAGIQEVKKSCRLAYWT